MAIDTPEGVRARHVTHRTNGSNTWATPRPFLRRALETLGLGPVVLDCAAEPETALASDYFGPGGRQPDALAPDVVWAPRGCRGSAPNAVRFLNPPYGRTCADCPDRVWKRTCRASGHRSRTITDWMARAHAEAKSSSLPLVVLVPARVGTDWWVRYLTNLAAVGTVRKGRARAATRDSVGPGKVYSILRSPPWWAADIVSGQVLAFTPRIADLGAVRRGDITFDQYADRLRASWAEWSDALAPGGLAAYDASWSYDGAHPWDGGLWARVGTVEAGATLVCSCAKGKPCHRRVAAPILAAAGWRVYLDGMPVDAPRAVTITPDA